MIAPRMRAIAYVSNFTPLVWSNRSTASISPIVPKERMSS